MGQAPAGSLPVIWGLPRTGVALSIISKSNIKNHDRLPAVRIGGDFEFVHRDRLHVDPKVVSRQIDRLSIAYSRQMIASVRRRTDGELERFKEKQIDILPVDQILKKVKEKQIDFLIL